MYSISVIIPSYNRATTLPRAIDSVLAQGLNPEEIIVIDDGSTDGTLKLLEDSYPDVIVISQENNGVSHARNRGIEKAQGNWIALLDSDDEWLAGKLEKQIAAIRSNPDTLLIHTDEIWIRNGKRVNQMDKHKKQGGFIFKQCLPLCAISPSSSLIHKSLFETIGLFDENLPSCEDYDLWLRICAQYPVVYLDEALIIKYGGHDDQLSRKHWGMDRFRIQSIARLIENASLSDEDRLSAISMLKTKIKIYLNGAKKHNNTAHVSEFERLAALYN
jgi:glycosyltransferase involved in cell wall biosynthesis